MGGGSVWAPFSLDAEKGVLYVPVSNPAPDFYTDSRLGNNLYTNSLLALDARTGRLQWFDQLVPADFHDWDVTQVSPLFETTINGKQRKQLIGPVWTERLGQDGSSSSPSSLMVSAADGTCRPSPCLQPAEAQASPEKRQAEATASWTPASPETGRRQAGPRAPVPRKTPQWHLVFASISSPDEFSSALEAQAIRFSAPPGPVRRASIRSTARRSDRA